MQIMKSFVLDIIIRAGERLAFISLLIVGIIVFLIQQPHQVFSASPSPDTVEANGLEYGSPPPEDAAEWFAPSPTPIVIPPSPENPPGAFSYSFTVAKITPSPTPSFDVNSDVVWNQIAACESNGNWSDNTGNGYFGGLQFSQGAWNSVGGSGNPASASREEQISRGKLLQHVRGWEVWGACAKELGLD